MGDDGGVSWIWLVPLGLALGAAGGLWAALRGLQRELGALERAASTLARVADEAGAHQAAAHRAAERH